MPNAYRFPLIFTQLDPPWVRQAVMETFVQLPGDVAVVLAEQIQAKLTQHR